MKDSGYSWLEEIPEHWQLLPGRACFQEKRVPNTGLKETTVLSLSYGRIIVKPTDKLHGLVPASFETYQIVEPGDIIVRPTDLQNDRVSLRIGQCRNQGIITSAYICLITKPIMTKEYGHLLLHAYDLQKIFYGLGSGLRQNLDWNDFKYLPCLVPPREEQDAIVRYLDYVDRRIKRYIRAKQNLIKLLNEQKQAIIHQVLTRGIDTNVHLKSSGVEWLGDIPENWTVLSLKHAATLHRGYDLPAEKRNPGPYPVVSSGGVIDYHSISMVKGPGVVTGRYGSTGTIYYIDKDFWPHNTSLFVSNFHGNHERYIYYLLHIISINALSAKSAVPGVDRKDIHEIQVTIPSIEIQKTIAYFLDTRLETLDKTIVSIRETIELLQGYHSRLINNVVIGRLDVRKAAAQFDREEYEADLLDEYDTSIGIEDQEEPELDVEEE